MLTPTRPDPRNLFRVHWHNVRSIARGCRCPAHLVLPESLTGVQAPDRRRPGRPLPDDRLPQGARRVRLPGAAHRDRPVRPHHPARDLAVDRQLLPGRRCDQPDHGLPRRGGAAGGHEPGALRLAGALGRRSRTTSSARRARRATSRRSTTAAPSSSAMSRTWSSSTSSASSGTTSSTTSSPDRRSRRLALAMAEQESRVRPCALRLGDAARRAPWARGIS